MLLLLNLRLSIKICFVTKDEKKCSQIVTVRTGRNHSRSGRVRIVCASSGSACSSPAGWRWPAMVSFRINYT